MQQPPPGAQEFDDVQTRIRNMFNEPLTPSPRATYSQRSFHSPPIRRGRPQTSPALWNASPNPRSTIPVADRCEDIAEYALKIVKDLEIPDDERSEKEEFCRELEDIVRRLRPSMLFVKRTDG
jgi:hypothetical protein